MTRHSISYVCTGRMKKFYACRWRGASITCVCAGTLKGYLCILMSGSGHQLRVCIGRDWQKSHSFGWPNVFISYLFIGWMNEIYVQIWRSDSTGRFKKKLLIVITRRVPYLRAPRQIEIILRVKMMKCVH